jgi:hypothetical protein
MVETVETRVAETPRKKIENNTTLPYFRRISPIMLARKNPENASAAARPVASVGNTGEMNTTSAKRSKKIGPRMLVAI